jgi:FdhD protein
MGEHERENPLARSIADADSIRRHPAREFSRGRFVEADERLAVEEPLEIRLGGRRFTLTMRTPGHDEELVAGFLLAEGFIESRDDLDEIRRVRGTERRTRAQRYLAFHPDVALGAQRPCVSGASSVASLWQAI